MTAREQRIVANDYYVRAMQMFEDHQAGLTEFVREEEVFDIILETAYNIWGTRLIGANLFEYEKVKNELKIDLGEPREIELDYEFVYQIKKTKIKAREGWKGFREHILWTMGVKSCWTTWGRSLFGKDLLEKYFKEETK